MPSPSSDAFEYVHRPRDADRPRTFPEVVLNIRDKRILKMEENGSNTVKLQFTVSDMKDGKVYVSRVDGNHRLYYAVGDDRRDALFTEAPFQIGTADEPTSATSAMKTGLILKAMIISQTVVTYVLSVRTKFPVCTGEDTIPGIEGKEVRVLDAFFFEEL
jgi:hypothetical protein